MQVIDPKHIIIAIQLAMYAIIYTIHTCVAGIYECKDIIYICMHNSVWLHTYFAYKGDDGVLATE